MQIYSQLVPLALGNANGSAVAMGFFDGIHIGHRAVIEGAVQWARAHGASPAVFTFKLPTENKMKGKRLLSTEDKHALIERLGVEHYLCPDFEEIKAMTPEQFVLGIVRDCNAKALFCGENFTFGAKAAGNPELLRKLCAPLGVEVVVLPMARFEEKPVSSTRIRTALEGGDIPAANAMLGMPYAIRFAVLWTGIPAVKIQETEYAKLANLETELKKKIIGQDEAVHLVEQAVKRSRADLSGRRRPASFIFVGPTGVGKTELVKQLANQLFDGPDPLIRLDMSEYMEKYAVSRMIGSPPGYVGYEEAGQLTEKVRRRPYSVVLFDEIEKAHPDVMNILLQILDEGKINDAQGRTVDFSNTVICMTSNAGSSDQTSGGLGFNKSEEQRSEEKTRKALAQFLRPEFLGRVDEVIAFKPLSQETLEGIAALMLDEYKPSMAAKGIAYSYTPAALKALVTKSQGGKFGARDLRRVIRKAVEDPAAERLIDGTLASGSALTVDADADGEVVLK